MPASISTEKIMSEKPLQIAVGDASQEVKIVLLIGICVAAYLLTAKLLLFQQTRFLCLVLALLGR